MTNSNTDYKKKSTCDSLVNGAQAAVKVQPMSNGTLVAVQIEVKDK